MKRKLPSGVHFQIACFTEGRSFRCCTKNRLILPQFYYFYSDIERIDFDFDIVTNVQVVGSPDAPIFSYLLLVSL